MPVVLILVTVFCLFTFNTFTSNSEFLFGGGTVSVKQEDKDTAITGGQGPATTAYSPPKW
jgi:hypothetical protein